MKRKGFTLVEIMVVVMIVGGLAAIAWPNYTQIKEKALNKEAKSSLEFVRAAEKFYRMEHGSYYPNLSTTSVVADINSSLKIKLSDSATRNWTIVLDCTTVPEFATATRTGVGADGRQWSVNFSGNTDICSGGIACL